ncbi:FHA domain-containing protein [Microbacterium sp. 2MCAF23]|uniref:FHA domain-containing protein n=1 Tax=Microbacterium sp. 2MCAF23 TaxID=3232985 RepID=UPI003F9433F3
MNTVYRAGSWFALIGPEAVVALPPDSDAALVERLWERVARPEVAFSDVVDALTAAGGGSFSAIPPFVAVVREGESARVAVRGRVRARVVGAGAEREITGAEVTTWSERFVPAMTGVEITVEEGGEEPLLPIVAGVVRAASILVGSVALPGSSSDDAESDAVPGSSTENAGSGSVPGSSTDDAESDAIPGSSTDDAEGDSRPGSSTDEAESDAVPGSSTDEAEGDSVPGSSTDDAEGGSRPGSLSEDAEGDRDETPLSEPAPIPEPVEGTTTQDPAPSSADLDDLGDTVLSVPAPVETMLPPADTIAAPLGGHTLDFSPAPAPAPALIAQSEDDGDHDGATISLAQARAMRGGLASDLPEPAEPASTAADLAAPISAAPIAAVPVSVVPGTAEEPGATTAAPAPTTGPWIRLSTGQVVALDRTVVIGRRPRATRSSGATLPHLVAVDSPQQDISRSHLEIRPEPDAVVVLDLHTTNGSTLLRPGNDPMRLHPGEQTIVVTGDVIDLGDGVTVAFEELP